MSNKMISSKSVNFLMIISLLSKAMGFLRDISLTYFWGADAVSDAFIIAITVPGTVCDLLVQAIAVGFIPTYTEIITKRDKKSGDCFTVGFIELLILCCIPIVFFMGIRPDIIIKLFASGFDVNTNAIAMVFIRITAFSMLFKMIVSVLSGYLQSNKQYVIPVFIGIPYDVIIIIGIICSFRINTIILPYSVIIAGAVQAIILIIASKSKGMGFYFTKQIFSDDIKSVIKLLLPLIIIVGANQINVMVDRTFASYVQSGAITILDYANKICLMIENIVVFSIVAVLYPELGKSSAEKDDNSFAEHLLDASDKILRYLIPASVYILILSYPIVAVLFGRGAFTNDNTNDTSLCMQFYSIGIVFVALRTIYTRALYAIKNVKSVTIISVVAVMANIALNFILVKLLGLKGLAFATSISNIITTVLMYYVLKRHNKSIKLIKKKSIVFCVVSAVIIALLSLVSLAIVKIQNANNYLFFVQLLIIGICLIAIVLLSDKIDKGKKEID